jgi:hypothetical protein
MTAEDAAVRAYRAVVRLYPRRFREEYGADMTQLMREQCREEPIARVLARALIDATISIPTQHVEARMRSAPNRLVPVVYVAAAVAGLVVATLGGSEPATLVLGLGLAVLAGTIGVLAWRRAAPVDQAQPVTASWRKFLEAGPCLVALVVAGAQADVDAWYLGMVAVLAAVISTAMGLVLGAAHVFARRLRSTT